MNTTANINPRSLSNINVSSHQTIAKRFATSCTRLEPSRCLVLAALLLIQGCIIAPVSLLVSSFINIGITGLVVGTAAAGTVAVLVSNISDLPMKYVIGTFLVNFTLIFSLILIHLVSLL